MQQNRADKPLLEQINFEMACCPKDAASASQSCSRKFFVIH